MISLKNFEPNLLKIDKKSYRNIGIYNVGYIVYLKVNHANRYIEEKIENKYLIFDATDENKELLKIYAGVWNGIKNKINAINSSECNYEKDYMKIKFNSDDDLPLNKPLKFHMMTIIIRSVFEEDGKLFPQDFLDNALYELSI